MVNDVLVVSAISSSSSLLLSVQSLPYVVVSLLFSYSLCSIYYLVMMCMII